MVSFLTTLKPKLVTQRKVAAMITLFKWISFTIVSFCYETHILSMSRIFFHNFLLGEQVKHTNAKKISKKSPNKNPLCITTIDKLCLVKWGIVFSVSYRDAIMPCIGLYSNFCSIKLYCIHICSLTIFKNRCSLNGTMVQTI